MSSRRAVRGGHAYASGVSAERRAAQALIDDGFAVLGRRVRTEAGEIDLIVARDDLTVFAEVKARPTLAAAAAGLDIRQRRRLCAAAEAWLASAPERAGGAIRFDVLLVDPAGTVRRIVDAFRDGE